MLHTSTTPDTTDAVRAGTWALLGRLLLAPPDDEVRERLVAVTASDVSDPLHAAWSALAQATREAEPRALREEYQDVFIGVGGGEVTPYASWYLTGALLDRPLVELREELAALGIERGGNAREPEDHAGTICETMTFAILDDDVDFEWQKDFFERYVDSWMERLFEDLGRASSARYYRSVGALGTAFLHIERRYYAMAA